jgi:hypothetical protein
VTPRRPIWQWIVLGLWLGGLVAITIWLIVRDRGGDPPGNALATADVPAGEPIPPARALAPAAQLDLAFRAAFGASRQARRTVGDQTYVYSPDRIEWIGNRAMLISLGRNADDCHACAGAMAIHYLHPEGDGLSVDGAWLEAGPRGGWGRPADEIAINREMTNNPIVYSTSTDGGQGYMCTVAWLVELTHEGPVASEPIPIGSSNAGAVGDNGRTMGGEPLREVEGRIANIRRGQSFDLVFTGAERFTETYHYRNGHFVGPAQSRAAC